MTPGDSQVVPASEVSEHPRLFDPEGRLRPLIASMIDELETL